MFPLFLLCTVLKNSGLAMLMFSSWFRLPLKAEKKAAPSPPPDIPGILPVHDTVDLLSMHQARLNHINELAGLSKEHFQRFYLNAIERFARFVQLLPASEVHHHAGPGGMLSHGLDVCILALKIRRSYLLSESGDTEDISKMQNVWTYAVFSAALCHDLAKVAVDQKITVYNEYYQPFSWNAWENFIDEQNDAKWYTTSFIRHKQYRLHEQATPILTHCILPSEGVKWIADDAVILSQWLACIAGDKENAAAIGEIVGQADQQSVATSLGADSSHRMPGVKAIPLHEKMLTALRFLLSEGDLPLNRNGAAGWIKGDVCWMVSKRTIDAIRDQLTTDGQSGIPTKNGRMFDILQEHGLLMPCGEKAIWTASVEGHDWQNQLTMIKFPVSKLWPHSDHRPEEFEGNIIPVALKNIEDEQGKTEQHSVDSEKNVLPSLELETDTANAKSNNLSREKDDKDETGLSDLLPFLPSTNTNVDQSSVTVQKHGPSAASPAKFVQDKIQDLVLPNKTGIILENNTDLVEIFFKWVRSGIQSGSLTVNRAKARIHVVDDGVILITPGIFQDFEKSTSNYQGLNWKNIQQKILKKNWHVRDEKNLNVVKFDVKRKNRSVTVNTILFHDASLVFGEQTPPDSNPHLEKS